jgi:hypothetical protein
MRNKINKNSWIFALALLAVTGCSKNKEHIEDPKEEKSVGRFLIAAASTTAETPVTYFLPVEALDDENASISPIGTGFEYSNTFTDYYSNGLEGMIAIKYGRGEAHIGQRFTVNASGKADALGAQFELQNGFITSGTVGNSLYTLMSGGRSSDPTLATMNRVEMASTGVPQYQFLKVNEFPGYEGENATIVGIADAGDGSFYAGLDLVSSGVDNVVIAKIKASNLKTEAVYTDSRLTVSGGQYASGRYTQIGRNDNGDVYVFSGNNPGTKHAGALVIKKGASGFDKDYYWDIQAASGDQRFRKIWHVKGDIFLGEFYNSSIPAGTTSPFVGIKATQFALLDVGAKKFTWISGLPNKEDIVDLKVKLPYYFNGKLYVGISTASEEPRIYAINPETGAAKKGLLVKHLDVIEALTFVEKK